MVDSRTVWSATIDKPILYKSTGRVGYSFYIAKNHLMLIDTPNLVCKIGVIAKRLSQAITI